MSNLYSIAAASLLLVACLGKDIVTEPVENPSNESVACIASALCRLENPADSSLLTTQQKERAIEILEEIPDTSANMVMLILTLTDLQQNPVRIHLTPELHLTIDSGAFIHTGAMPGDSLTRVEWWGFLPGNLGVITLYFIDGEIQDGYAIIGEKFFKIIPLGGNMAFVQLAGEIGMGECSAAMKPAAGQLTCGNPLP